MTTMIHVMNESIMITLFVLVMMVIIDYVNVFTKGRMEKAVKGGKGRQYTITSFLGSTPGCLGAFMNVSFYVHGLVSFGAIVFVDEFHCSGWTRHAANVFLLHQGCPDDQTLQPGLCSAHRVAALTPGMVK